MNKNKQCTPEMGRPVQAELYLFVEIISSILFVSNSLVYLTSITHTYFPIVSGCDKIKVGVICRTGIGWHPA